MADEILIRFSVRDDGSPVIEKVNQKLKQTGQESKAMVPGLENARKSLTGFVGDNAALIGVLVGVGVAIGKVLQDHIKYADAVRTLSSLSGESAENTSRFIQVLDDYGLSAEDALAATRALTKNGLAPNIETLAKLSDQYLAINDVEEKNEFILKNLGRGGAAWTETLKKGSKALLEQGAAVSKNLLLTEKLLDDALKAKISMDTWNDSVLALKTSFAVGLLPVLTSVLDATNASVRAHEIENEKYSLLERTTQTYAESLAQAKAEQEQMRDAMLQSAAAGDENTESLKAQEAALKAISAANESFIGTLDSVAGALTTYRDGIADAKQELAEGKITLKEYSDKVGALGDTYQATKNQVILSIVEMKLAQDGWTDAELESYLKVGEQLGVFDQEMIDMTASVLQQADNLVSGTTDMGWAFTHSGERALDAVGGMDEFYQAQAELAAGIRSGALPVTSALARALGSLPESRSWTWEFNIIRNGGGVPAIASWTQAGGFNTDVHAGGGGRDSGGPGVAGNAYMIGTGAQPEMFVPNQNGTFVPNADKNMIDYKKLARVLRDTLAQAGG